MKYLFLSLRPGQWVKNLLVFIPLIFGKKLFVFPDNLESVAAFAVFCLAAGAAYLINDVVDIEIDMRHPVKHSRPVASGKVSVKAARVSALILAALSVAASFALKPFFGLVIICYLILNFVYTKFLKKIIIIDVLCLGVFFLSRIVAGSVLLGITMSYWMIIMTVLLALFLGFNKRRQEIRLYGGEPVCRREVLRRYSVSSINRLVAAISVLILVSYTFYTIDSRTVGDFGTRNLIYSVPFVFYGIFRYLYLIYKFNKDGDPTNMLFSDIATGINLAAWIIVCILVIYPGF
jgi:4-hydroxybenzoate polyprenyltransferase